MILSPSSSPPFVFASVTKCATMTMFPVLEEHYGGFRHGDKPHHRFIQPWCRDYFTFSVCRNPYDRAVSLWWSTTQRLNDDDTQSDRYKFRLRCPGCDDFATFIQWLASARHTTSLELVTTQAGWLAGLRIDQYLRFEHLDADFKTLPFYNGTPEVLPQINATIHDRKPWQEYMTPESVAVIDDYYGCDFDKFGYERWEA